MARDSRRPCASAALCSSDIGIVTTPLLGPEGRLASLYIVKCANSQNRGYERVSRRYPKSRRSPGTPFAIGVSGGFRGTQDRQAWRKRNYCVGIAEGSKTDQERRPKKNADPRHRRDPHCVP